MWGKLKASLRKSEARTVEELDDAMAEALEVLEMVAAGTAHGFGISVEYDREARKGPP